MAVTVQMQFESVVTELYEDAFIGSSIENGTTIIQFDLRKLDFQRVLETTSTICWCKAPYSVEVHELSTSHNPLKYRFIVAQGYYLNDQNQRVYFTPEIKGVSTAQHMSHSIIRLACYLAVVCGVSLRHIALLFAALFLMPITKSSIKRWIDDIGTHLPIPEEMLRQLLAIAPATECHIDGYYPLGTDHCVMVVKDEHDRILITHEAASENGDDARQFLQRCKDLGLNVTAAFSDYSQSFTEAIKAVFPHARFQADHFRRVSRQLVNLFDYAHSEAQATLRLQQLRRDIHAMADHHLEKIPQFLDDHWEQALRYLRKKGMGKHRRGSNSESGMRLLRRLEKNHDGIRSAATRQHYIQIYQAMKYLSLDVADFIEKGPQLAELPDV